MQQSFNIVQSSHLSLPSSLSPSLSLSHIHVCTHAGVHTHSLAYATEFYYVTKQLPLGSLYSLDWTTGLDHWTGPLDWTTGLDYWTGLLDSPLTPQIPTKMSYFSAVDSPRLQLCPLLCQYILSNRLSSQIGPSNMFSSSA